MKIIGFIGSFSVVLLCIIFIVYQVEFLLLFNRLKKENSTFLNTKIKKYSMYDARSQLAKVILWGEYKEIDDKRILSSLNRLRLFMLVGLSLTFIVSAMFILTIIITHAK